ncbi:hypothetical protein [Flavobacterium sangjuense]|uniref:Lipocalin-like domain-containing protein n=1 Tax=Flavobacterium sangjuense TaxID=2518177 RepID=A0A4P7PT11_9FLAO|nr:hypothetical protein [Flavobacterium sangjuense]QBZ98078.1 hypothetical protein GS03_01583 [Flavobacterium sangjuense]
MKKLLSLSFLFIVFAANAQIKVAKAEAKPIIIGKTGTTSLNTVEVTKTGDLVTFKYQNDNKPQVAEFKTFSFRDIDGALEGFYGLIIEGFTNLPKEDIKIELPKETVNLQYTKSMNIARVKMKISYNNGDEGGVTVWLTKKQIDAIFGKS